MINRKELTGKTVYEKIGCLYCGGSGYAGRIPVFEVLKINKNFKNLIHTDLNDESLRSEMHKMQIPTMADDAVYKMTEGLIDFHECYQTVSAI